MTGLVGIVGLLVGLGSVTPQIVQRDSGVETQRGTQQVVSGAASLVVATPVFGSDGSRTGAQATFPLTIGKTQVLFAGAGASLCESGSATPAVPDEPDSGWRLEVLPRELTAEGVLILNVAWQWRGSDGRGRDGNVTLRLPAGGRVQLDHIGAEVKPPCQAIGMALELARPVRPATGLYEVETWLVPAVSGEAMQHQVLRLRLGDSGAFHFDDLAVPDGKGRARIQGTMVLGGKSYNGFDSEFTISRQDIGAGATPVGGSSTYPLKASSGEVVEFRAPMGSFALRVRVKQLR